jgi:hypothetical protein
MGFYKFPPPPQPLAKRKKQEPKFRDLLRKQNSNLLSPNQKPTKSTWKAPKTVAYFNTRGYEKVNDWVTTCVGPAKEGGEEPDHLSPQITPNNPPWPPPPFLPYFPTYLPLSLPPSLPRLTFFVSSHGSATKVEGHKRLCCAAARFSHKNRALFSNFGPPSF